MTQPSVIEQIAAEIAAERRRQVEQEGWTPQHDDEHADGTMAWAAAAYALSDEPIALKNLWPWEPRWWKPKDRRRDLIRAAALIAAEIERRDRQKARAEADNKEVR